MEMLCIILVTHLCLSRKTVSFLNKKKTLCHYLPGSYDLIRLHSGAWRTNLKSRVNTGVTWGQGLLRSSFKHRVYNNIELEGSCVCFWFNVNLIMSSSSSMWRTARNPTNLTAGPKCWRWRAACLRGCTDPRAPACTSTLLSAQTF